MVAFEGGEDVAAVVEGEEVDEPVDAGNGEAGLILECLFQ